MIRLILIGLSLLLSVAFMLFEHTGEVGFKFSDMVLSYKQYAHDFEEHVIRFVLSLAILSRASEYKFALKVFVMISFLEIVDYMLTYGEPWFGSKVFTWNTIKCGMFILAVIWETKQLN